MLSCTGDATGLFCSSGEFFSLEEEFASEPGNFSKNRCNICNVSITKTIEIRIESHIYISIKQKPIIKYVNLDYSNVESKSYRPLKRFDNSTYVGLVVRHRNEKCHV